MTTPEKIEQILNQNGDTLSDLPKPECYSHEQRADAVGRALRWHGKLQSATDFLLIEFACHQSDVFEKLVKTHEAKLMTLEDIDRIRNMNLCGTWPFNTPPYLWISKRHSPKPENWICWRDICHILENRDEKLNRENYGICWRLWTKQPTDEQREAKEWITPQRDIDELLKETQWYIPDMLYEELKKAVAESCLTFKKPEETLSECWERGHMVLIP